MKTRAAVAFKSGAPLEVVDVDLEGPKAGEVLVRLKPPGFAIRMLLRCQAMILRALSRPFSATRVRVLWWMWARILKV